MAEEKIRIGISSCLLGERVRYDGGHKLDSFLVDTLGRFFEYVPVCPEVECGLTVPREQMRLEGDPSYPRLVTLATHVDHTDRMLIWANRRVRELEAEGLSGFIFKSKSPSCGLLVEVYPAPGASVKTGAGLFARCFMERFPLLPAEDEDRLHDPGIRENFMEGVYAFMRSK